MKGFVGWLGYTSRTSYKLRGQLDRRDSGVGNLKIRGDRLGVCSVN